MIMGGFLKVCVFLFEFNGRKGRGLLVLVFFILVLFIRRGLY